MADQAARENEALARCLVEAGWSPRALAQEINRVLGRGAVSGTAPYYWRDHGGLPRPPVPALVAYLLSRELGRTLTVGELWEGRAVESSPLAPATLGMDRPWRPDSTRLIAEDWVLGGLLDRRVFLTVSGTALARAVCAYLASDLTVAVDTPVPSDDGNAGLVDQVEQSIPLLQRLDDAHGGAAHLGYVGAQVRAVALVLREGGHTDGAATRLLRALADLAQLAGWMAVDAGQNGLAQRYFFTGLRAAYDTGYWSMAGHILADLSFQAVALDQTNDAVVLGEAARRVCARSAAGVRASVLSRLAHAYAAAGRAEEFDRTRYAALDAMVSGDRDQDPAWMYYLTPTHLDCQAGYSMIGMGRDRLAAGDRSGARQLLHSGEQLLRAGAHDRPAGDPSQRRALFEGTWLALGQAAQGNLADACATATVAVSRLHRVRSPRSTAMLAQLVRDLRQRKRSPVVREHLPELETVLSRHL